MLYAIVAVIALILDQLLKYWTTISIVVDTGEKKLIPGVIHLSNVHNSGAAFSFLQGARWFFVILCIVFVVAVIYLLVKNIINTPGARWCAVIVMAGAVGNCIDRIINGYVVDMLEFDFKIFGMRFPVFNIADIYITLGAIAFCVFLLVEKPEDGGGDGKAAKETSSAGGAAILDFPRQTPPEPKPVEKKPENNPAGTFVDWKPAAPEEKSRESGPITYSQPAQAAQTQTRAAARPPETETGTKTEMKHISKAEALASAADRLEEHGHPKGETKTEHVMRMLVNGSAAAQTPAPPSGPPAATPAEPAPAAAPEPAPAPQPAPGEPEASYNLDDILAEFRDL